MQSANAVRPVAPDSEVEQLPETFEKALAAGWVVVTSLTTISTGQKKRSGKVFLGLEGRSQRLAVPYTATKAGFRFDVPQLIQ